MHGFFFMNHHMWVNLNLTDTPVGIGQMRTQLYPILGFDIRGTQIQLNAARTGI
jgi:hypothetical protein